MYDDLMARSGGICEMCSSDANLTVVTVTAQDDVLLCPVCRGEEAAPVGHWRCLEGAAWSQEAAVQIAVWRKLGEISEAWAAESREMMDLAPDVLARASTETMAELVHRDSNGAVLAAGDTVVLIKDLPVKGGGFTAKRGTAVRGISLVDDNAGHIEGRVEGQRIVILTEFVKKK